MPTAAIRIFDPTGRRAVAERSLSRLSADLRRSLPVPFIAQATRPMSATAKADVRHGNGYVSGTPRFAAVQDECGSYPPHAVWEGAPQRCLASDYRYESLPPRLQTFTSELN
jgi:hypothetical protein